MTDDSDGHEEDTQNWWTPQAADRLTRLERRLTGTDAMITDTDVEEVTQDSDGLQGALTALVGDETKLFYVVEVTSENAPTDRTLNAEATKVGDMVEDAGFRIHHERREREQRSRWFALPWLKKTVAVFRFRVTVEDSTDTADTSTDTTSGTETLEPSTDISTEEQPSDTADDATDGTVPRGWRQYQVLKALHRTKGTPVTAEGVVKNAPGELPMKNAYDALKREYNRGRVARTEPENPDEPRDMDEPDTVFKYWLTDSGLNKLYELKARFDAESRTGKYLEGQDSG
jgi:hypothetical protein